MAYFNELPNILYQSPLGHKTGSGDYIVVKNLFRNIKLLDYLESNSHIFNKYVIKDGERPDTLAKKVYNNSEYDYVVILSARISNIRDQWPLDNRNLYEYSKEKYGIEKLNEAKTIAGRKVYETVEVQDNKGRVILPKGISIDEGFEMDGPDRRYNGGNWVAIRPNGRVSITGTTIGGNASALLNTVAISLSNYQYEVIENDKKRNISILKPSYLQIFLEDFRRIMRYDRNSQYINPKLMRTENTRIVE
jgi:hypothetical protein|tara:strand:+ start:1243 stop:1989 length:747 start_codon:yes stop_codon:yes gene_type:complete